MSYYANIRVLTLNEDVTTKKMLATAREDMDFRLLVNDPSEIKNKAKKHFSQKHGPDLVVRSCNLQDRTLCVLYCMPKEMRRNVVPMHAHGTAVKPLKSARR